MTVERVARAVAATRGRSTARLRHRFDMSTRAHRLAAEETGVVDFSNVRHEFVEGDRPRIVDRGDSYDVAPDGRWYGPGRLAGSVVPHSGPHWLLDLLGGTTLAEAAPDDRIVCTADAVEADARSETGLFVPSDTPLRVLRAIVVDVWIGDDGLIRRLRSHVPNGWREFEFWDFDVPAPIALPPPELVDDPLDWL